MAEAFNANCARVPAATRQHTVLEEPDLDDETLHQRAGHLTHLYAIGSLATQRAKCSWSLTFDLTTAQD
jgi:hypothetical protein